MKPRINSKQFQSKLLFVTTFLLQVLLKNLKTRLSLEFLLYMKFCKYFCSVSLSQLSFYLNKLEYVSFLELNEPLKKKKNDCVNAY